MGPTCAGDILWAVSAVHLKIAVTSCTVRMKIEHYATLSIMCVIHGPVTPCEILTCRVRYIHASSRSHENTPQIHTFTRSADL